MEVLLQLLNFKKSLGVNEANVTLVNKHSYHYQTTWLHENAAGTLHHDHTRIPIKDVINTSKINFVQDTVTEIKPSEKTSYARKWRFNVRLFSHWFRL